MDQIDDLLIFAELAKTGSMSQTATNISTSKSHISKRIHALEDRLQAKLINSSTKGVELTQLGKALLPEAESIRLAAERAESKIAELQHKPLGTIQLAAPPIFATTVLVDILQAFKLDYPDINFSISIENTFIDILKGSFDLCVRASRSQLKDSELIARPILKTDFVVCGSPEFFASNNAPEHPKDLEQLDCCLYALDTQTNHWQFKQGRKKISVELSGKIETNQPFFMKEMVKSHQGFFVVPKLLVAKELASGELMTVLDDYQLEPVTFYLIYPQRKFIPEKVKVFMEFVQNFTKYKEIDR